VAASIRALGPVTPRSVVYGTLTAALPTDEESVRLTRAYTGFYTLVFSEPELGERHGATYPTNWSRCWPSRSPRPGRRATSRPMWTRH